MSLPESQPVNPNKPYESPAAGPWSSPPSGAASAPLDQAARSTPVAGDNLHFDLSVPSSAPQPTAFEASPHAPAHDAGSSTKGGLVGGLIALGMLLLKFKSALVFLKFGKIFTTMSSMLLSVGAYSMLWGWKFATGFVLLIFVHEMGHVWAAWWKKLPVSAPMFIPFMGAVITLKEHPQDALTEAQIGYGGPALGALGCTLTWGLYYLTGNALFLAVASVSMMVNLFNLVPVSPLDGGRIVAAISPRVWLLGMIGMVVWFFVTHSFIILLVLIFGGMRLAAQWKTMGTDAYYKVAPRDRLTMTLLYISLVIYLAWGHSYTHHLTMNTLKSQGTTGLPI